LEKIKMKSLTPIESKERESANFAQNCQKNYKIYTDCAKNDKKCALFTKKLQKITKNTPFLRVYPELFEGHSRPKPTTFRQTKN